MTSATMLSPTTSTTTTFQAEIVADVDGDDGADYDNGADVEDTGDEMNDQVHFAESAV